MDSNTMVSNLKRSAKEQVEIERDIMNGVYGPSGSPFVTTKTLSEQRNISVVTAHKIMTNLAEEGYIELRGRKYFLTYHQLIDAISASKKLIGVVIPETNNEFFESLVRAIVILSLKEQYRVLLMDTEYSPENEKEIIHLLQSIGVAGIIDCGPVYDTNKDLYETLSIPLVFLSHPSDGLKISSVQVNSYHVSEKIAEHLIEEGYQNFLYIGTKNILLENDVRFNAFQMKLRSRGYVLSANSILRVSHTSKNDMEQLKNLLLSQSKPTGVYCYHDLIAARVYRICQKAGRKIPDDFGVVGFDDLSFSAILSPGLTTVRYRINTMADMALKLLLDKIKNPKAPYDHYYIEPNLIYRESTRLKKEEAEESAT